LVKASGLYLTLVKRDNKAPRAATNNKAARIRMTVLEVLLMGIYYADT
jgi:hypothetical protein